VPDGSTDTVFHFFFGLHRAAVSSSCQRSASECVLTNTSLSAHAPHLEALAAAAVSPQLELTSLRPQQRRQGLKHSHRDCRRRYTDQHITNISQAIWNIVNAPQSTHASEIERVEQCLWTRERTLRYDASHGPHRGDQRLNVGDHRCGRRSSRSS